MKKTLFIVFSLILIFSSKMFAAYPGYPGGVDPSVPSEEDLAYPDYTCFDPVRGVADPEDHAPLPDGDNSPEITHPFLDEFYSAPVKVDDVAAPQERAVAPQASSRWWRWLTSWFRSSRPVAQTHSNQDGDDATRRAILEVEIFESDEQMAQRLQRQEELGEREKAEAARMASQIEEGSAPLDPPTWYAEPSAPPEDYDGDNPTITDSFFAGPALQFFARPVPAGNRQEQEIETQINNVLSRIVTLEDLHLLLDEFGMSDDKIIDLTGILGISYLDDEQLAITPEGKVCVREFITSHIEELSR